MEMPWESRNSLIRCSLPHSRRITLNVPRTRLAPSRAMKTAWLPIAMCAVALCLVCGCGAREKMCSVQGTVTYGTEPVAEGTVTFEESVSKATVQAVLSPAGKYSLRVAPGTYKVMVEPPLVAETRGSDPGQTFKKVKNIPNKVRLAETTPLSSTVEADATLDFDLKK